MHGSWFLTLEFPRDVNNFAKFPAGVGEACFFFGISNSLSLLETLGSFHELFNFILGLLSTEVQNTKTA